MKIAKPTLSIVERRVVRAPEACTHCGACVGQCSTGALTIDALTYRVELSEELCRACGLCAEACSFAAIAAIGTRAGVSRRKDRNHVAASNV